MARNNDTKETNKETKAWMLHESEVKDGISYQITYLTGDKEGTIAYGQVRINDFVAIKCGLVHSKGGHDFWSFPSKKGNDGNWYDDVIPMNKTAAAILKAAAEDAVDVVLDELLPEKEKKDVASRQERRSRR